MSSTQESLVADYEKLEKELLRKDALRKEIEQLKVLLKKANDAAGRNAFEMNGKYIAGADLTKISDKPSSAGNDSPAKSTTTTHAAAAPGESAISTEAAPQEKNKGKKVKAPKPAKAPAAGDKAMDVSRLNMVVGKIVKVDKHPEADGLYLEEIDVGEGKPRTIISGLVKCYTLEDMQDRDVIVLLNLKPAKMRGILSSGMVMCGVDEAGITETVTPPAGSKPGDAVTFEGYTGTPDAQLNPKKKIFEQIQPGFKVNADGEATWNDVPFIVGTSACTVPRVACGAAIR
eukprot:CFRG2871T1